MNAEERRNLLRMLDADIRPDGRKKTDYRAVEIETGVSETAEGSAKVTIGDTIILAGVKMELITPYADTPDQGALMVGVELSPIASNDFETGPPSIDAIELARVTDRQIRESRSIDVAKLCVKPGEKVWSVNVDITVLNDDGNLFDGIGLAAMAAIKDAKMPSIDKDGNADYHELTKEGLPLEKTPIGVTVIKVGQHLIVDPTRYEMKFMEGRLTVGTIDDGTLCSLQKGGLASLDVATIGEIVDLAVENGQNLRKLA